MTKIDPEPEEDFEALLEEEASDDPDLDADDPAENWIKRQLSDRGFTRGSGIW